MAEEEVLYGRVVSVQRLTEGDRFAADAAIGATVLSVFDTADFDEDGGQVRIGADVYDYSSVDDVANTVTLTSGLLVAASAEDALEVIDAELDDVVVEYVADILLDGQDSDDDPIEVTVQQALVDFLSEAVRGGASESVTLERDGEDDWQITQLNGRLANNIAIEVVADDVTVLGSALDANQAIQDQLVLDLAANDAALQVIGTTADGKNSVYYKTFAPTNEANKAGDTWYVYSGGTVSAQYRGNGGTSWTSQTLTNVTVSSLDAGAITSGTIAAARIAATQINASNITTGTLNAALIAVQNLSASSITSGTLTGRLIRTESSGERIEISSDPAGDMRFYSPAGSLIGYLDPYSDPIVPTRQGVKVIAGTGEVKVFDGGVRVTGSTYGLIVDGNLHVNSGNINLTGQLSVTGGPIFTNGQVHGQTIWSDGDSGGSLSGADIGADGKLRRTTSARRYKHAIEPADFDLDAFLALVPVTYRRNDEPDEPRAGFIADEVAEAGLREFVGHNAEGEVDTLRYADLTAPLLALCQRQQAQIDDLTARLDALEAAP